MMFMPVRHSPLGPKAPTSGPRAALDAGAGQGLAALVRRAQALAALDQALRPHLPEPLREHSRLGNFRDGVLVFLVDAPVWKTRLRLDAEALLRAANAAGIPARNVRVKVVEPQPERRPLTPPASLSARSREALRQTAESLDDPELRDVLLKLASVREP